MDGCMDACMDIHIGILNTHIHVYTYVYAYVHTGRKCVYKHRWMHIRVIVFSFFATFVDVYVNIHICTYEDVCL